MSIRALIHRCISNKLLEVYTSMPAVIVDYDKDTQLAQVKPLALLPKLGEERKTGIDPNEREYEEIDVVFSVMVKQTSGDDGKTFIHLPVKKGDKGMLCICNRSLEDYTLNDGKAYKVKDYRHHDISDSYFLPGILPKGKSLSVPNNNDIFIKNDKSLFQIGPDGKFKLQGGTLSNIELLQIIEDLIQTLLTSTVATMAGPQQLSSALLPPGTPGNLADLLSNIKMIKKA
jgi:hypothetical protein